MDVWMNSQLDRQIYYEELAHVIRNLGSPTIFHLQVGDSGKLVVKFKALEPEHEDGSLGDNLLSLPDLPGGDCTQVYTSTIPTPHAPFSEQAIN